MNDTSRAWEHDIEEWASRRAFAELDARERAIVIATLGTSGEYDRLRAAVLTARSELARSSPMPDPAIARDLHAALRARSTPRRLSMFSALFTARIPAYQAVLAIAAAVLIVVLTDGGTSRSAGAAPAERRNAHAEKEAVAALGDTGMRTTSDDAVEKRGLAERARPIASLRPPRAGAVTAATVRRSAGSRDAARRASSVGARADARAPSLRSGRIPKDSAIAKPNIEHPNHLGGLDNMRLLAHQRRGVTLSEDTAYRRFSFAVN
jgi:hypothetical protein